MFRIRPFTSNKFAQFSFNFRAMDISLILLIFFQLERSVNGAVKTWIKDQSEPWGKNDVVNQNNCTKSKAIFQKEIDGFLYIDSQQHQLQEIVLPTDGAFVLPTQSNVRFIHSNSKQCESDGNVANYLGKSKRLWFSTTSWQTEGESVNVAKPDVYKIPCECDTVEFPSENIYTVDLQYVDEIVVNKMLINDRTADNIEQFLETSLGQKMFANSEAVHFHDGFCQPQKYCGCHNHIRFRKYTDILCEEESKYCREPHCFDPIKPDGHCCPICGAILNFEIGDTCDFNMTNMNEVGRKLRRFRNGKYLNKLDYYAGMIPGRANDKNIVQLVVAEVDDYSGISVEFMDFLTKDPRFQGILICLNLLVKISKFVNFSAHIFRIFEINTEKNSLLFLSFFDIYSKLMPSAIVYHLVIDMFVVNHRHSL